MPPLGHIMSVMFRRAIAPTAGAVRYSSAMKTSAQPADQRASDTFGTVKKRMITCGRPAVPIISDRVKQHHVQRVRVVGGIFVEAQLGHDGVEFGQQRLTAEAA